jgi:hypothetical protein
MYTYSMNTGGFIAVVLIYILPGIFSIRVAQTTHKNIGLTILGVILMPIIMPFISLLILRDYKKKGHTEFRLW